MWHGTPPAQRLQRRATLCNPAPCSAAGIRAGHPKVATCPLPFPLPVLQNWAAEQCHLPKQYYQGLLPVLQACPDTTSILALTSQLWQSGMLRMLCNAYTASLQQQASALAMLQGATGGGAAAAAGLSQLTSLLTAATGGLGGPLTNAAPLGAGAGDAASAALAALLQAGPALVGALQDNPALASLLSQAGEAAVAPTAMPAAPPLPVPQPQPQPQPSGRPQRSTAGRGGRLSRPPSPEAPPPAKRSRRGGAGSGGAAEPPPPPQLQQLLDILSGEALSPRDPASQLLALQQQPPAAAKGAPRDEAMPDAQPAVAIKTEPGEHGAVAAASPQAAAPAVSAFAAAAQQIVPSQTVAPGAAAAALAGHHRSLSLHRSLSSQLPLPPNQPNVRIVAAAAPSREASGDLGAGSAAAAAAAAGVAKGPRPTAGGRSIELTITAPPPLQHHSTPFGAGARARATITTGASRPATAAAPAPVTTGTAGGAGAGEDGAATPCNGGMVSAFAAAAAALPAISAPPQRPAGGKGGQPRPMPARTLSTPATVTTGITSGAPPNRSSVSRACLPG